MKRRVFLIGLGGTVPIAGCISDDEEAEPTDTSPSETDDDIEPEDDEEEEDEEADEEEDKEEEDEEADEEEDKEEEDEEADEEEDKEEEDEEADEEEDKEEEDEEADEEEDKEEEDEEEDDEGEDERQESPELTVQDEGLESADTPFHNSYAKAVVENTGNARSGRIELTARWFESGDFIGEDTTSIPTLDAGESWLARVGTSRELDEIDDFELSGEFEVRLGDSPEDMSIENSNLSIDGEYNGSVTAEVANDREESLFMASFAANIYDEQGYVIGGAETLESDISAGEDLFFDLSLSSSRKVHPIADAEEHSAILTETETPDTQNF